MNKHLMSGVAAALVPLLQGTTAGAYSRAYSVSRYNNSSFIETAELASLSSYTGPSKLKEESTNNISPAAKLDISKGILTTELIIIDQAVPDKHVFYSNLKPGIDIVEIKSEEDGLAQIEKALNQYTDLDALHIVSHASDGQLQLGNTAVTEKSLSNRIHFLNQLDRSLKDGADLLLYGCNVAQSKKGDKFLELISQKANVDIAASDDFTGNSEHNADWELEIRKGEVNSSLPFSERALKGFDHVLAINDAGGRTIDTTGFTSGFATTKSYDVDASGFVIQVTTDGADPNASNSLYSGNGYVAANLLANVGSITSVYLEFANGASFDIDSIDVQSTTTRNYVFTPSTGSPVTASISNASFNTQMLNFSGITRLTIKRQDGLDLEPFFFDNLVIKNTADTTAPTLAEVTPVVTPSNDSTPDVTFSTDEGGTLAVGGSCGSGDEGAIGSGNQTITLTQVDNSTPLADGTYSDCTVTVTDASLNASTPLTLTSFTIDATAPVVSEVTPITTPGNDSTPDVTFNSNEAGTLAVGGSCGSSDEGPVGSGNTTITLTQTDNSTPLADAAFSDCTITITDSVGNSPPPLDINKFYR